MALLLPVNAHAQSVPITTVHVIDLKKDRREARLKQKFCRRVKSSKGQIARLLPLKEAEQGREEELAMLVRHGESGCPSNIDLAIALVESHLSIGEVMRGSGRLLFAEAAWRRDRGTPADLERAEEIARMIWLRDGTTYAGLQPRWSGRERADFLTRTDVWPLLVDPAVTQVRLLSLRREMLLDPETSRFDPVRAVDELAKSNLAEDKLQAAKLLLAGKVVPADPARAEELLTEVAKYDDKGLAQLLDRLAPRMGDAAGAERPALTARLRTVSAPRDADLKSRLAALVQPGLAARDFKTQTDSAWLLSNLMQVGDQAQNDALLGWIENALKSRQELPGKEARSILGWLVTQGFAPARVILDRDILRTGGLVEAGDWTPDPVKPTPMEKVILSHDYPTRALREERTGVVRAAAVFDPNGKVLLVEVLTSSGSPDLDRTVQATLQRRMRRAWPEWPGRYVRVKLPPVQFRISGCDDEPPTPAIEGAVLVDGVRFCRQPDMTPIY